MLPLNVKMPVPFFVIAPPVPLIALVIVVFPVPATVRVFPPRSKVGAFAVVTESEFDELFVHVCEADSERLSLLFSAMVNPAPLFTVIPPLPRLSDEPVELLGFWIVGFPSSTRILLALIDWPLAMFTLNEFIPSLPAEKTASELFDQVVVATVPPEFVDQFAVLPISHTPVGVAPAPVVAPLVSQ